MWQAHTLVGSYPTELIGMQATTHKAAQQKLTVLIVGGNPGQLSPSHERTGTCTPAWTCILNSVPSLCVVAGCAAFYRKFMQQLHSAFDGTADILAVSHVGHDTASISQGKVYGLDSQVDHKAQLLAQLQGPTVVLAHSIGSYVMLQALQQLRAAGNTSVLHNISKVREQLVRAAPLLLYRQCSGHMPPTSTAA